jgi:hypothetical protein
MVRVLLLWAMVDYNLSIRYHSVAGDMSNFIVGEEEYGVGSFGDTRFALGKAMDFLAKCGYPEIFEVGIMLKFLVLCDCLLGNGMVDTKAVFFNVDDGPGPLQLNCHFEGFESHGMMHSLDGNVTRQVSIDKTYLLPRWCGRPCSWAFMTVVIRLKL